MNIARCLAAAAVVSVSAGLASAGGLDDPIIAPAIIADATVSSGHDILVPLVALILFGAAVAASD